MLSDETFYHAAKSINTQTLMGVGICWKVKKVGVAVKISVIHWSSFLNTGLTINYTRTFLPAYLGLYKAWTRIRYSKTIVGSCLLDLQIFLRNRLSKYRIGSMARYIDMLGRPYSSIYRHSAHA